MQEQTVGWHMIAILILASNRSIEPPFGLFAVHCGDCLLLAPGFLCLLATFDTECCVQMMALCGYLGPVVALHLQPKLPMEQETVQRARRPMMRYAAHIHLIKSLCCLCLHSWDSFQHSGKSSTSIRIRRLKVQFSSSFSPLQKVRLSEGHSI